MALVSRSLFRNWWDDIDRYHREIDEHFRKLSVRDNDLWPSYRYRSSCWPRWDVFEDAEREIGGWARVERTADEYRITVDVQFFSPEEITVRTDDQTITVEARHFEKKDGYRSSGYVSRQFIRRYLLPRDYDVGRVKPSLSSDGFLTITAPRLSKWAISHKWVGERNVPIRRTYLPAIKAN